MFTLYKGPSKKGNEGNNACNQKIFFFVFFCENLRTEYKTSEKDFQKKNSEVNWRKKNLIEAERLGKLKSASFV